MAMAEKCGQPDQHQSANRQMARGASMYGPDLVIIAHEFAPELFAHGLFLCVPVGPHLTAPLPLLLVPLARGGVEPFASRAAAATGFAAFLRRHVFIDRKFFADAYAKLAHE